MDKAELIVAALQQRIGELVAGYETQIAVLRADITQLLDERNAKEEAIKNYSDSLNNISN